MLPDGDPCHFRDWNMDMGQQVCRGDSNPDDRPARRQEWCWTARPSNHEVVACETYSMFGRRSTTWVRGTLAARICKIVSLIALLFRAITSLLWTLKNGLEFLYGQL